MKRFILGFAVGAFLTAGLYFFFSKDKWLHSTVGRVFDKDVIFMKDGSIVYGRIQKEEDDVIFVETDEGVFTLPRWSCMGIEKNPFLKYLREAM